MQHFHFWYVIYIKKKMLMNLNCALLHTDAKMLEKLESFVKNIPFLTLCGSYTDPLPALKEYYASKVDVYVVGISPEEEGEIGGMDFCRLLSSYTRVIFVADTESYAAACFRLDALDYLVGDFGFSVFFQAASKAMRWFTLKEGNASQSAQAVDCGEKVIYLRSDSRIVRLRLEDICYIESCGDYVKVYCRDEPRPFMSLCTLKAMEERLPEADFVRVHRSYIVRKRAMDSIDSNTIYVGSKEIPIGDAYRDRLKASLSRLMLL